MCHRDDTWPLLTAQFSPEQLESFTNHEQQKALRQLMGEPVILASEGLARIVGSDGAVAPDPSDMVDRSMTLTPSEVIPQPVDNDSTTSYDPVPGSTALEGTPLSPNALLTQAQYQQMATWMAQEEAQQSVVENCLAKVCLTEAKLENDW
ncbi:hypothetical protein CROQUDRAFT_95278 [Cronartium quercuum f. sp. fusiforme G11]|uniref:Uncharacterized protein n=1 Tax=Cronartium quercuum f. sp. fusiforme G11 TaxID=708437 RepID=A0A9P6NDU0_9BASI|nr:hypothetical protein CROQUDRAFT_95278 [Cronartium quercuum f. sp. fusiforme G11]